MITTSARLLAWMALPELGACHLLNRWGEGRTTRTVFGFISRLGDGPAWYLLIFGIAAFGGTRGPRAAAHLAAIGILCLGLYRSLKRLTKRPRPFAAHRSIHAHIAPLDEFSFPSGHTLHATSFSIVACAYYPALTWVLAPLTLMIALSRVVLGLHYPSDVLAAFVIGAGIAVTSLLF